MDIDQGIYFLAIVIGGIGLTIITYGVLLVFSRLVRLEFNRVRGLKVTRHRESLRHLLGSYLLLGLEFLIAADVVNTFASPSLNDIMVLAGIVGIRTIISFFLDKELADYHHSHYEEEPQ